MIEMTHASHVCKECALMAHLQLSIVLQKTMVRLPLRTSLSITCVNRKVQNHRRVSLLAIDGEREGEVRAHCAHFRCN